MEQSQGHAPRFLALMLLIVIAYSLATSAGQVFKKIGVDRYVSRLKEQERRYPKHSEFGLGLYGYAWCYGMEIWADLADAQLSIPMVGNLMWVLFPGTDIEQSIKMVVKLAILSALTVRCGNESHGWCEGAYRFPKR